MGSVWELDFYSRPILDENQKKVWEVLICEGLQTVNAEAREPFRFSKFLSNSEVNSIKLKEAIEEALAQAPARPSRIRFFRYQMQNMISRACEDAGLSAKASRRTLTLQQWLDDRKQNFYPHQPGYTNAPAPTVAAPPPSPQPLPDALMGQKWAFVTLEAAALQEMPDWEIDFGEAFPLELAGISPDTPIPGILIFSPRAMPLAGWMSGLELGYLRLEQGKTPRVILETGPAESWILANLTTADTQSEAKDFEVAKQAANQVHFIGVQANPEADSFAGFWLLQERNFG
ncbi:Tab2/Atab2 family RNA-binding protein [Pseudanabaena sp. FACHB-2040]|uniref:Tab2/Atab2 family RNA-binding protein n=1 Tax=Pseudanabaena sp. FACHB-2040 TaxID=2692859 RepID=UPI001686977F|nr:Tab2/Atab2 family RNA-binding protein [Pseudanabaena sp. FACHB-2040]MBD0267991.1 Tab2/Atab2 family RNA-binding protein [Cyanobacteria bacterium Co-bin8]MBD2260284.1 Tab2/Atab2 family RNA-binding protein [Pseudanabaena sp. FACHB-2040]